MIKKFFLAILDIIAALVIVFAVAVLVVVIKAPAGSVPSIGGYTVLRVVSGSMEPDYPIDAMLFVHKVNGEEIRPGDVISFYSTDPNLAGAVNTHRVVSVEKDEKGEISFTTKGDANPLADLYKTPADRRGRQSGFFFPYIGQNIKACGKSADFYTFYRSAIGGDFIG